jgi:tetratricopeptide (TPR) repeat protein
MRGLAALAVLTALAACSVGAPVPHTEADWAACTGGTYDAVRISACTTVASDTAADDQRRAAALVQRGVVRAQQGQLGRAVADFGRALRFDPNSSDALVERGRVHQQRGAFDIALRDYDAALAIDPNLPLALEQRESALEGRFDTIFGELDRLDAALRRDPQNPQLLNNRCWLRATSALDLEAALADCDAAIAADPTFGAAWDSRGLVHLKRGEYEAALADYERALEINASDAHYLYGRGLARQALGRLEEAQADFAAAEVAEPGIGAQYRTYGI